MAYITYTEAIEIAAPVETVWTYRLDYQNLPAYNPQVTNLRRTDGGTALGPGARYEFDLTLEGFGTMPQWLMVASAERPSEIRNEMGPWEAREVCRFSPSNGGTHVEFEVTTFVPDDAGDEGTAFIERSGREQVRLELDLMKENLER